MDDYQIEERPNHQSWVDHGFTKGFIILLNGRNIGGIRVTENGDIYAARIGHPYVPISGFAPEDQEQQRARIEAKEALRSA